MKKNRECGFPLGENPKLNLSFKKMKLTLIFSMLVFLTFGNGFSQAKVTLHFEKATIRQVLKTLEDQTGHVFLYKDDIFDPDKKYSVDFTNESFEEVLKSVCATAGVDYEVRSNRQIILTEKEKEMVTTITLQQQTVTGVVTDQRGLPLPGVTIVVKGTTTGTVTNADGNFSLAIPPTAETLQFSFVGMRTQEVFIEGRTTFSVVMEEETIGMEEVVVVGYGTRMREELTGSVSTVSSDKIEASTAADIGSRMQGQITGVSITTRNRPGGGSVVRVRGMGTINNNDPLYIIDGVPTKSGLNEINPNDVESISVLKDASSAAIYGSRGANGVIIITTKRGRSRTEPRVNFSLRTGINQLSNQYELLNTQEYGELLWLEAKNSGMSPGNAIYGYGASPVIPDYIWPIGASEGDPEVDPSKYHYYDYLIHPANKIGTNWMDEISQNGILQEYNLSVAGGSENSNYIVSAGYLDETGYLIHTGFERMAIRNNVDVKVSEVLKVGQSMSAILSNLQGTSTDNSESSPISQTYRNQPIVPVYDIMGNFAGSRSGPLGNGENPVAQLTREKNNYSKNLRLLGNIFAEFTILKDFSFKSLLGYDYRTSEGKEYTFPNPEAAEPRFINALNDWRTNNFQWNWSNTINFDKIFLDIHRISIIAGTEAVSSEYKNLSGYRAGYFSTDPRYMVLNAGETGHQNTGGGSDWKLFSLFGRINYDLHSKYYIEATLRRDGSSRFSKNYRYSIFPAFSGAWILSSEDFMVNTNSWLDFLKIRMGWGKTGNDEIGNYNAFTTYATHEWRSTYDLGGTNTSSVVGFQPDAMGNPNARWETTLTVNLGVDAKLLNNKLNFSFDVWERNTSDMLYRIGVPYVAGVATPPFVNIGDMQNKGFDLELGYNNSSPNNTLRYNISANISRYINEIIKLSDNAEEEIIAGLLRNMYYSRAKAGTAFPEFYGYIVDGIFQTQDEVNAHPPAFGNYNSPGRFKYRDINNDGVINADDMTYIGSPHPDFTGGLNFDIGYKNFDLNLFFYGSYGNDMVNYVRRWIDFTQFSGNRSKDRLYKSWGSPYLSDNQNAILPIADYNAGSQQPSTHFVEDGSFLRLKNLKLSYTFSQKAINRAQLQNIQVYMQVSNLFTITKYSGLDPELYSSGTSMGLDQGAWPTSRQMMFGINIGL